MSKRKSFGRFTAMSLAGISAVSSMAIVSNAEAYPTAVYEFTYNGIKSVPMFDASFVSANLGNGYVTGSMGKAVFENGFSVTNLDDFDISESSIHNKNGDNWEYMEKDALSENAETVKIDEYINPRGSQTVVKLYFKTMAERDAAVKTIVTENTSEYTSKYNAAYSQLSADLKKASTDKYNADLKASSEQGDVDAATTAYNAAKDAYELAKIELKYATADEKDAVKAEVELKKELMDAANSDLKVAQSNLNYRKEVLNREKKTRDAKISTILAEFKKAYAPSNFDFDYTNKTGTPVFLIDDSNPYVTQVSVQGGYIQGASYGSFTTLENDYYRTVGQYVDADSYAFTGEIISSEDRIDPDNITAYLLNSDRWSLFSVLSQGAVTDNNNTTETDKDKDDKKDEDKDKTTTWYPSAASYRIPNSDSISFRGKNNYWYTSSGAAEVYGGGYTGVTLKSNYSDVKGSKTVYFSALDGRYYTTNANSYSYIVEENKTTTTTTTNNTSITDPYYYYYLMSQNGGYVNTTTKIDPDAPTIYGSSKRSGWAKILSAVKGAKNGTVTIDMNAATTIPADVIKAAMANNVTIKAVNANGSIFTVDGSDVNYATAIDTTVQYNVKVVSNSLKNKAIKVNKGAVSTTQVVISEDGDLGADATVTVKLSAKRAGYTVKAYRVSSDGKKLTCEAKGTVKSNGSVNLNLDNGGKYVLVLIK